MAMTLSSRARYGVHAMFQFASHWGKGAVTLRILALEKGLSLAYLEQLILIMWRSGLVKSVRGRLGGYQLARNPKGI
jgi:Rrf2 family protein